MFNWARSTLSMVAGTAEPEYGPTAIHSVAEQTETTPYTEIDRHGIAWSALHETSVETKTFYITLDSGEIVMLQAIYSNVADLHVTSQFVSKIFYPGTSKPFLWCSDQLSKVEWNEDQTSMYAENLAVELAEDGKTYTIKSTTNENALINIAVTRKCPSIVVGKNGTTLYGTDVTKPWGRMRHAFWPRCVAKGTIITKDGSINVEGSAFFVHALQGMKPHHAAAKWNFVSFQGKEYSAMMMEFTTPSSYATTTVNVGAIVKEDEVIYAGCGNSAEHLKTVIETDIPWPEPSEVRYKWSGKTSKGEPFAATLEGSLNKRLDRVDVMAEVPAFVKAIISAAVGTKPYVYQYAPRAPAPVLKLKIGEQEISDEGQTYAEASFVC